MSRHRVLRVLAPIIGRVPWLSYPVADAIASTLWYVKGTHRNHLIRNILPFCDGNRVRAVAAAREAYRNIARYWVDITTVPHREMANFERDHLTILHGERLAVIERPGPVIVVSAHTGNTELALQALTFRGRPFVALVESIQPPELANVLQKMRSSAGGEFHFADFGGIRACVEKLRDGGTVGLVADRDIQGTGTCVRLAGRMVKLPVGPWELARKTGATVLPVFAIRERSDHFIVEVEEPFTVGCHDGDREAAVNRAVERWAGLLETHLRRNPGQWTVLEDFWQVHRCG
jgi:phosphatidylinositol dimannoside acyltransferase